MGSEKRWGPTCSDTRARTRNANRFNAIAVTHGSVGAEIMTRAERATDANQMRHSRLKRQREGGTRAEPDKLWNDNTAHAAGGAVDWTGVEWLQHRHQMIHVATRQVYPNNTTDCRSCALKYFSHPGKFFSYGLHRCLYVRVGPQSAVTHTIWVFFYMWDDVIGN